VPVNLIYESGAGLNTANSYVDVQTQTYADGSKFGAEQYFADRLGSGTGNTLWFPPAPSFVDPASTQPDPNADIKRACLIKATYFLDYYWRSWFKGQKKTQPQNLCWPRVGATIDEGAYDTAVVFWPGYGKSISTFIIGTQEIPIQVKMCCCELASRSAVLGNFMYPGELAPDITDDNFVQSEKIGPIEVTYRRDKPTITILRFCEMLLAPILRGSGGSIPLARG
jgi:hypothetical protein